MHLRYRGVLTWLDVVEAKGLFTVLYMVTNKKQWVFMRFLLATGRIVPNFMVSPVLVQSAFKTVDWGRCYDLVWQGVPWCYDSPGKEFAADASCDGSVDLEGISSGLFITGWREVRLGDLVHLVNILVCINHVASDSSVFKTWQWEFPQSLWVLSRLWSPISALWLCVELLQFRFASIWILVATQTDQNCTCIHTHR